MAVMLWRDRRTVHLFLNPFTESGTLWHKGRWRSWMLSVVGYLSICEYAVVICVWNRFGMSDKTTPKICNSLISQLTSRTYALADPPTVRNRTFRFCFLGLYSVMASSHDRTDSRTQASRQKPSSWITTWFWGKRTTTKISWMNKQSNTCKRQVDFSHSHQTDILTHENRGQWHFLF